MWSAEDVVAYRIAAQQLDRPMGDRPVTDAAILDLGVQDTGQDGASWALANRGVPVGSAEVLAAADELALVWSLRGAPHFYRRADLPEVLVAVSPFSADDAAKRIIGADAPLKAAGIETRTGMAEVAGRLRELVREPMVKGEASTQLSQVLEPPYLRSCLSCGAVHTWELTFRYGATFAGLELEPGTSPPVLRPVPHWPVPAPGPAPDPTAAPERLQIIRGYLRFLGPATPREVAGYLDGSVADIRAHWPEDAVEVEVAGQRAWTLGGTPQPAVPDDLVRLLGPFDLLLQGKDRHNLVPDQSRHKALWPALGRPGAVLAGARITGVWRPRAAGRKFTVRLTSWSRSPRSVRTAVEEQAAALAAHRGLTFAGVVEE